MIKLKKIFLFITLCLISIISAAAERQVLAAIEIGSKGIKAIAVEMNVAGKSEDEIASKTVYKNDLNPNIMSGVTNRLLQKDRIKSATDATVTLFNELKKLDPQFIVLVASTAFDNVDNRDELSTSIKAATGQSLDFITGEDELYFGLLAAIPKKLLSRAILIDVGSGNTKIGYSTPMNKNGFEAINIPFGTVTLKEKAKVSSVQAIIQNEILPNINKLIQDKPGITNPTRTIYILGGASWALTNLAYPEEYVKPYAQVKLNGLKQISNSINSDTFIPKQGSEKYNSEVSKIFEVFTPADLKAGGTLLISILQEIGGDRRRIVFPRESGWIFGYMYSKYYENK